MKEFFDKNEERGMKLLYNFNLHTNLFSGLDKSPYSHYSDATGYTVSRMGEKRKFNIEIKQRNAILTNDGKVSGKTFQDNTVFIESHKYADLVLDLLRGYEPLYINFLLDGTVIIWNLNKLKTRPLSVKKYIKSEGYNGFEIASRQGLYLSDAVIYKDNKIIKKMGEEWKTVANS